MKFNIVFLLSFVFVSLSSPANSTLIDRGAGLIYDTELGITWIQDANYAMTTGYDSDGRMTWEQAMAWVDQLVYGGYDDWRLPTTIDGAYVFGYDGTTTAGYNIMTSEMGYMYYVNLGNLGYYDTSPAGPDDVQLGWGLKNVSFIDEDTGLTRSFQNLQPSFYWSGTECSITDYSIDYAWRFLFKNGYQDNASSVPGFSSDIYAWAVRDGDSIDSDSTTVPEPATIFSLGLGIVGLVSVTALRKKMFSSQR